MRRVSFVSASVLCFAMFTSGCSSQESNLLAGQWRIELDVASQDSAGPDVIRLPGTLVFHPDLPNYPDRRRSGEALVGRAYIDYSLLGAGARPGRIARFGHSAGADRSEEIVARTTDSHTIAIDLSPNVVDFETHLTGVLRNDTVRGTAVLTRYSMRTLVGPFVMWRVPPDQTYDSALIRARRAVSEWR